MERGSLTGWVNFIAAGFGSPFFSHKQKKAADPEVCRYQSGVITALRFVRLGQG
jgi:hypothetical protein